MPDAPPLRSAASWKRWTLKDLRLEVQKYGLSPNGRKDVLVGRLRHAAERAESRQGVFFSVQSSLPLPLRLPVCVCVCVCARVRVCVRACCEEG